MHDDPVCNRTAICQFLGTELGGGELMQEQDNDRGIGRQTRVRGWKETDPLKYEEY